MSALVGQWIRRYFLAGTPAPSLRIPSAIGAPVFSWIAHMADTHSCQPNFRPSHIAMFRNRSARAQQYTRVSCF